MKVLFCFPPPEDDLRLPKGGPSQEWYGVGIGYLQAYLEKHGHQTDSYQEYFTIWSEYCPVLMKKIEEFKPDIIAVQLYSMNRFNAFKILEICKERKIKCVFGGIHASAFPNEIISHFPRERGYDLHVVCGEGEIALLDIVEGRETGQIVKRDLIQDLDSLPYPKHDEFFNNHPERKIAVMVTSRGCPFSCTFCCLGLINGRKIRYRSVDNVIDEIVYLKKKHPHIERITFQDDAFSLNSKRVIEIADRLIDLNLGLKFQMAGTVKGNTEEMFAKMEKAGLENIYVGLESGNQGLLDRAKKGIKLEEVEQLFKNARKYPKLIISTYLITGLPGETWGTVEDTVNFVKKLQAISYDFVDFSTIIWAYPATELYEMMKDAGVIDDEYWFGNNPCLNYTLEHSLKELIDMQQYVLNRVSLMRIFTPLGFYHQILTAEPRRLFNTLRFIWYHPKFLKYALGDSMGYMFPRLYTFLRGYKLQPRWLNAQDERYN